MNQQLRNIIFLIIITFGIFANTLGNKFVYDDAHFIVNNDSIKNLKNIPSFFTSFRTFSSKGEFYIYRPMSTVNYAVDYALWKLNPLGFHLSSVLWHVLNVMMLYLVIGLILKNNRAAFIAALLFAVHPVQTESVAWVSQLSTLISTFFLLGSLWMWIKLKESNKLSDRNKLYLYFGSVASYFLAMLGKEMAITLPAILILYEFFFVTAKENVKIRIKEYIPFIIAGIFYVILRSAVLGRLSGQDAFAGGSIYTAFLTMIKAAGFYISLLIVPVRLCAARPFPPAVSLLAPQVLGSLLLMGMVLFAGVRLYKKSTHLTLSKVDKEQQKNNFSLKQQNSSAVEASREISFFIFWFFITLLPVSNLIPLQDVIVAERFLYIPSIGFCAVAAIVAWRLLSSSKDWLKVLSGCALSALLIYYCSYTVKRNIDWKDELSFCTSTLKCNPSSYSAHNGLGLIYTQNNQYDKAVSEFLEAIKIKPDYFTAYYNLATAYEKFGFHDKALEVYESIKNTKYYSDEIMFGIAESYQNRGLTEEAVNKYNEVLKINPSHAKAHNNLGCLYLGMGRTAEAAAEFKKAVNASESYFEGYYNLGTVKMKESSYAEALELFNKVLKIKPDYARAYSSIGDIYSAKGDFEKAIGFYRKAITFDAKIADIYNNLASAYNNTSRYGEAVELFKKALEMEPGHAIAHNGLGVAYWGIGRKEDAMREIKKALEINPGLIEAKHNYELIMQSIDNKK